MAPRRPLAGARVRLACSWTIGVAACVAVAFGLSSLDMRAAAATVAASSALGKYRPDLAKDYPEGYKPKCPECEQHIRGINAQLAKLDQFDTDHPGFDLVAAAGAQPSAAAPPAGGGAPGKPAGSDKDKERKAKEAAKAAADRARKARKEAEEKYLKDHPKDDGTKGGKGTGTKGGSHAQDGTGNGLQGELDTILEALQWYIDQLKECEKNCPPKEEGGVASPPPAPPPAAPGAPRGGGGGDGAGVQPAVKLPKLPDCWKSDQEREDFFESLAELERHASAAIHALGLNADENSAAFKAANASLEAVRALRVKARAIKICPPPREAKSMAPAVPVRDAARDSRNGETTYRFESDAGAVSVVLPSDVRAGDTISGVILTEPAGATPAARREHDAALNATIVDVQNAKTSASSHVLTFVAPAAGMAPMSLSDTSDGGRAVGRTVVPVGPAVQPSSNARGVDALPRYAQSGRALEIAGVFGGDLRATAASFAGRPARILAESPRSLVVDCPDELSGPTELAVTEAGRTLKGPIHILRVTLSATSTTLLRGETATITIRVEGLVPAIGMVPLSFVASQSIQVAGGNVQSLVLDTRQSNVPGVFETTRGIRARQPGGFEVSATIVASRSVGDDPLFPGAFDMNGVNSVKQLPGIVAVMSAGERTRRFKATLDALHKRLAGAQDSGTKDWLNDKIAIVEGTMDSLGIRHRPG